MSIVDELCSMNSYEALENVLVKDKLIGLQTVDTLKALLRTKSIIMYDTGMGKTYIAAAYMRMLLNQDKTRKFIMLVKHNQLSQTPEKLESNLGVPVISMSATAKELSKKFYSGEYKNYPVLMITHDCLKNSKFMHELFKIKEDYFALIIDEAHNLNNKNYASSAGMLKGMCSYFQYILALTATPIISDTAQLARLASLIDSKTYPNEKKLEHDLNAGRFRFNMDPCFFISRSREDFGIRSEIHGFPYFVQPQADQVDASGADLFRICKGPGAVNQATALVQFIKEHSGEKGLVFINEHNTRNWVLPFLKEAGIRVECINGYSSFQEKSDIMKRFNESNDIDVIITSITESIDLDCSWVMFYEFTLNIAQMIGRAYRGLYDKVLNVYFMITKHTGELDYFTDKIYRRSEIIRDIVGKEYTAVFETANKISVV